MDKDEKLKAREALLKTLNKDYDDNTVGVYGDMPKIDIQTISSGSFGLDAALGVGGWARGRMVEIYGNEASGKTTLTLHAIAEAQKAGGLAAFIDAEHALDPDYAQRVGVDMDDLTLSQPDSGEDALNIAGKLVASNVYDIVVIDSVAALTPIKEIDGEVGDYHVGAQARMMSQALRKLAGPVHKSKTTLVFINQTRQKIGVMFGNPTTTSGGKALPFYASQRVEIARIGNIKKGDDVPGCRTRCTVKKNKVAPPFRKCEFDIVFGEGINKAGEILDAATTLGMVVKSGSWYKYHDENIGQGRDGALDWFKANPDEFDVIETQVRVHYGF